MTPFTDPELKEKQCPGCRDFLTFVLYVGAVNVARKRLATAVAAGLVGSVALVVPPAPLAAEAVAPAGEYVVTFDPGVDALAKARKERALGNEVSDVFTDAVDGLVATLDANDVRRLRRDGDVLAVEPNSTVRIAATAGRYIVQLRAGTSAFAVASAVGATNVTSYQQAIIGFAADLTAEAYDRLSADSNVVAIEPD
ncbi:MAG: hypothetical protein EBV24_09210, partial [Actinobacteria bacterium]|nr:hypothetical protein [Actinomycetota bacterium]